MLFGCKGTKNIFDGKLEYSCGRHGNKADVTRPDKWVCYSTNRTVEMGYEVIREFEMIGIGHGEPPPIFLDTNLGLNRV